jgi:hypothetical protein
VSMFNLPQTHQDQPRISPPRIRGQRYLRLLGVGVGVALLAGCNWFSRPQSQSTPAVNPTVSPTASPSPTGSPTPGQTPTPGTSTPSPNATPSPGAAATPPVDPEVAKLQTEVEKDTKIAKQNPGLVSLKRYLEAERAQRLIRSQFSGDLKAIEPNLPTETEDYRFVVQEANRQRVVIAAIAKRPTIPSFTGAAYAVEAKVPISGACGTPSGSQTPPSPPTLNNQTLSCSGGALLTE